MSTAALLALGLARPALGMVGLAALVASVAVLARWRRHSARSGGAVVANVATALAHPAVRRAHRRYVAALWTEAGAATVAALVCVVLVAGPYTRRAVGAERIARDVVLCLDVSGSMTGVDRQLVDGFASLAANLRGQRIGLTVFDNSAITVFPLTDDETYVAEQLRETSEALRRRDKGLFRGTYSGGDGTSLIGDGLVSCLERFDAKDALRARSIVLATDNHVSGKPQFQLAEATRQVETSNVKLFAVAPEQGSSPDELADLRANALATGGGYYPLADVAAANGLAARIMADQGTPRVEPARWVRTDATEPWLAIAALGWLIAGLAALVVRR